MLLSTDAYYFALFPIIEQIGSTVGIDSVSTAYAMIIGNIVGTFISPLAPAVWLALGLSGLEMGKHIRYSFFWLWGLSLVLIVVAIIFGIISIYDSLIVFNGVYHFRQMDISLYMEKHFPSLGSAFLILHLDDLPLCSVS